MKYVERPIGPALESKFQSRGHRRLHRRTIVELDVDRPGSRQPRLEVRLEERDLGALDVALQDVDPIEPRVFHDPRPRQAETVVRFSSLNLVNGAALLLGG